MRTCVGCRSVRPAGELVRVIRREDGGLVPGRSLPGRGAWICRESSACLAAAVARDGFSKAFGASVRRAEAEGLAERLGSVERRD